MQMTHAQIAYFEAASLTLQVVRVRQARPRRSLLLRLPILIPLLLGLQAHPADAQTAAELRRQIDRDGAAAVLRRVAETPEWSLILKKIERGSREWLLVAIDLHRSADSHDSETLALAVGAALVHAPARVLALAVPEFGVESVCSTPDVDDSRFDSLERSKAELERRIASVKTLPKSKVVRDCLARLNAAKGHVRRFYGE